jgi:hypothetical protein
MEDSAAIDEEDNGENDDHGLRSVYCRVRGLGCILANERVSPCLDVIFLIWTSGW